MSNPDQRDANEIIAESLLAIEGRLVRIEKTLDDLTVVLEMLTRYIMQETMGETTDRLAGIEAKIDRQNANVAWYTKLMEKRSPIMDQEEYEAHLKEIKEAKDATE